MVTEWPFTKTKWCSLFLLHTHMKLCLFEINTFVNISIGSPELYIQSVNVDR